MLLNDAIRTFDPSATALVFPLEGIGTGNVSLRVRACGREWRL